MVRTVAEAVTASEVRVEPKETPGIEVDGVPADLDHVAKADVRVDLKSADTRAFVVEHVLGPLGLHGVTAARVEGVVDAWDFVRPEHRFCYAADLPPSCVVGHPHGLPNPALAEAVASVGVVGEARARTTVTEAVDYEVHGGDITLRPREYGAGVRFEATYGDADLVAEVDPAGGSDADLVADVTTSTTPYLAPDDEEAVTHSIADLVSDVAVLGGFDDVVVEANLGGAYHALTVGVSRAARERGVVERREA
jgi:UDP-3-O-acyl-N-acetylglucosamine deacetylase